MMFSQFQNSSRKNFSQIAAEKKITFKEDPIKTEACCHLKLNTHVHL